MFPGNFAGSGGISISLRRQSWDPKSSRFPRRVRASVPMRVWALSSRGNLLEDHPTQLLNIVKICYNHV